MHLVLLVFQVVVVTMALLECQVTLGHRAILGQKENKVIKEHQASQVVLDFLVLLDNLETWDYQEILAFREIVEPRVQGDPKALWESPEQQEYQALLAEMATLVYRDLMEIPVQMGLLERRVNKGPRGFQAR